MHNLFVVSFSTVRKMSTPIKNPAKALLRKEIKGILSTLCDKSKNEQTSIVTQKVIIYI